MPRKQETEGGSRKNGQAGEREEDRHVEECEVRHTGGQRDRERRRQEACGREVEKEEEREMSVVRHVCVQWFVQEQYTHPSDR